MIRSIWIALAVAVSLLLTLTNCAGESRYTVSGPSMEPTFHDGQVIKSVPVKIQDLKRGDIVAAQLAGDKIFFRRLIGMPEETIEIRDGHVLVNGRVLPEPYRTSAPNYQFGPLTLARDEFFILADNTNVALDSHTYGPVHDIFIKAKYVP